MKINSENLERLKRNANLMKLYMNIYLRDTENENFRYVHNKFFKHEELGKTALINTGTGLFTTIPEIYSNYTGNPYRDYKLDITRSTIDYSVLGFCVVGLQVKQTKDGLQAGITYLPSEGYFKQDGIDYIARVYSKKTITNTNHYLFIQGFYTGYTKNKLYKMTTGLLNTVNFEYLTEVPLTEIQETSGLQEIMTHPRDHPALYVVLSDEAELYPTNSDIEKIKNQVYAMDRKKVMFDCEFLKNVESFLLLKGITLPSKLKDKYEKGTRVEFNDLGRVVHASTDASMEFINNNNPLIKDAMESQKDDMRLISTMTTIPMDFLGMETAHGAIGKGSRSLLHGAFIKKIESLRSVRDNYLPLIIDDILQINGGDSAEYTRPDVFTQTDSELLDEVVLATKENIISKERAMMMYMGFTQEQASEEMEKIVKEKSLFPTTTNEATDNTSDTTDTGTDREEDDTVQADA